MQAPPAFSVAVSRFGVWRGICLTVSLVAVCAAVAWAWALRDTPASAASAMLLGLLLTAPALWPLLRPPRAFHLRWDTQAWLLDATPGQVSVAVDTGGWMLLRFVPDGRWMARWLPVQRRGHETAWHALRCTVYCARPPAERFAVDL